MVTLVDPATGQEKLGIRFRELPSNKRQRRINATVAPAEALAPQPEPLTALLPSSSHTSVFHTGAGDSPQVVVAFNQPVVDFDETTPSLNVTGATVASVSLHIVAGESANAYVVTLTPAGASDITVRLVADQPCADGGICTAGETLLSEVPASHVIRADTTPPTVSKIEVSSDPGTDRTYAAGDEIRVTVTFSETVFVTGTPQLRLELGGGQRTGTYEGGSGTAALVFGYTVAAGESDTDGVGVEADSLSGGTIRDGAGHNAVLDHQAVAANASHKVDGVKPALAASGGAVVNGTALTLTYDEPLDGSSTPATGDFTVSGGDRARTVTGVRVNGSAVELTLDVGAEHGEAGIQVSYTPGDNPIRDVPGNDAEALSREPVANDTPDTTSPTVSSLAITSSPGSNQTYAAGEEIEVTVTFNETVEVEGTPQLRLKVGTRTRTAGYDSGTGTASLVFAYEVADGDEDTGGVSIEAGRITLNGGTIEDEADNDAVLDHEAVAPQAGHQVDGVRPAFVSAAVDGASLTLTYGEALDGGSRPAPGDFTVQVDGTGRSVSGVSVNDAVVTLTLNPEVEHGDTGIRVSYTPGTNPLRDEVGNDALGLSSRSVTNTTDAPNTAPQITSPSSFDVPENQAMVSVATLTASDDDTPIDQLTWTIPSGTDGGADASSFTLSQAGVLAFTAAKDYETPDDADTDRTYEVTVEVSDGTDSDMAELLVTLLNVTELTAITGPESVTFPENSWSRVATFTASSEEDRAGIEWILGGTDRDHFSIDNPPGALRFALDAVAPRIFSEPPDFEAPVDPDAANTYELTLSAEAGSSVTDASFTVTVTVTDVDEEGALSLSSTRPALGAALRAVPSDPDGVTAGTALWQWERSTGRNSWAVIDGAAAESYTPVAADTNTFLRVTATYDDEHGTGKTVSEVAPNVVTGLLLTGLTAETDDSRADTARGLYPAFDPQTLHYGIGCNSTDTLVLTVSAAANARVAVAGVQAASAPVSVAVTADSDVAIRLSDASGAGTTYVVHCLRDVFFEIETVPYPGTDLLEDLILFNRAGLPQADGSKRRAKTASRFRGREPVRRQVPPDRCRWCVPLRVHPGFTGSKLHRPGRGL